ncbi:MAG: hypothetical protein LBD42_06005 [Desulfovibrio sp.]|jgi:hypothetical protein|nr:hypothetical protein [Desulfovibrio sp.]
MRLPTITVLAVFLSISASVASAHECIVPPEEWQSYEKGKDYNSVDLKAVLTFPVK